MALTFSEPGIRFIDQLPGSEKMVFGPPTPWKYILKDPECLHYIALVHAHNSVCVYAHAFISSEVLSGNAKIQSSANVFLNRGTKFCLKFNAPEKP
jgi:hypothetical protein